jgi:hypothetical protein
MIRHEPETILSFLHNHFNLMQDLFFMQKKEGIIHKEELDVLCSRYGSGLQAKLKEYKVLRPVGTDFEMRDSYYKLFEFLLYEFRPLLPETIEKYKIAISELFNKIRKGIHHDSDILVERIKNVSYQVREFLDLVEKNALRLLSETRDLKSNIERVDYREKVHKASFWIEYYILPLNKILDINQPDSIASKLLEVSEYANRRRLDNQNEISRLEFEKLYNQLIQTHNDLLKQSRILTTELLPLLERIRTESLLLTGWIEFLRNPYKVEPVALLKPNRGMPQAKDMYHKTKEFFEQFTSQEPLVIEDTKVDFDRWIFDRELFKDKLEHELPLTDFFSWCMKTLKHDFSNVDTDKLFAVANLLFDEDLLIEFNKKAERLNIKTQSSTLTVPKLKIYRNGLPE